MKQVGCILSLKFVMTNGQLYNISVVKVPVGICDSYLNYVTDAVGSASTVMPNVKLTGTLR